MSDRFIFREDKLLKEVYEKEIFSFIKDTILESKFINSIKIPLENTNSEMEFLENNILLPIRHSYFISIIVIQILPMDYFILIKLIKNNDFYKTINSCDDIYKRKHCKIISLDDSYLLKLSNLITNEMIEIGEKLDELPEVNEFIYDDIITFDTEIDAEAFEIYYEALCKKSS